MNFEDFDKLVELAGDNELSELELLAATCRTMPDIFRATPTEEELSIEVKFSES